VTAAGRRAFNAWLDEPPTPATIEIEAVLRVMFADRGTKAQLVKALEHLHDQGHALQQRALEQGAEYAGRPGLEHRMHLAATGGRFVHEYAALLERYATWAKDEVSSWPSTGADAAPRGERILAEQLRLFG
jgi:hypothetical protein